jgi:hypothetical protein
MIPAFHQPTAAKEIVPLFLSITETDVSWVDAERERGDARGHTTPIDKRESRIHGVDVVLLQPRGLAASTAGVVPPTCFFLDVFG